MPLLSLPLEVRTNIYRHVFNGPGAFREKAFNICPCQLTYKPETGSEWSWWPPKYCTCEDETPGNNIARAALNTLAPQLALVCRQIYEEVKDINEVVVPYDIDIVICAPNCLSRFLRQARVHEKIRMKNFTFRFNAGQHLGRESERPHKEPERERETHCVTARKVADVRELVLRRYFKVVGGDRPLTCWTEDRRKAVSSGSHEIVFKFTVASPRSKAEMQEWLRH